MLEPPSERKSPRRSSREKNIHQPPTFTISAPRIQISWFLHHMPNALSFCVVWITRVSLSVHGAETRKHENIPKMEFL